MVHKKIRKKYIPEQSLLSRGIDRETGKSVGFLEEILISSSLYRKKEEARGG
jgi:hypothetical protein